MFLAKIHPGHRQHASNADDCALEPNAETCSKQNTRRSCCQIRTATACVPDVCTLMVVQCALLFRSMLATIHKSKPPLLKPSTPQPQNRRAAQHQGSWGSQCCFNKQTNKQACLALNQHSGYAPCMCVPPRHTAGLSAGQVSLAAEHCAARTSSVQCGSKQASKN